MTSTLTHNHHATSAKRHQTLTDCSVFNACAKPLSAAPTRSDRNPYRSQ